MLVFTRMTVVLKTNGTMCLHRRVMPQCTEYLTVELTSSNSNELEGQGRNWEKGLCVVFIARHREILAADTWNQNVWTLVRITSWKADEYNIPE